MASSSASSCSAGIMGSISVYFCKSAAVNCFRYRAWISRRVAPFRTLRMGISVFFLLAMCAPFFVPGGYFKRHFNLSAAQVEAGAANKCLPIHRTVSQLVLLDVFPLFLWLLPPFLGLVFLPPGVVELNQPLQGLGQADLAVGRDLGRALLHSFVTLQEQWFGLGVLLLAQQTGTRQAQGMKARPTVREHLLSDVY